MDGWIWTGRKAAVRYRDADRGAELRRIFCAALALRLIVLAVVMLTPWKDSFMGINSQLADDWRYEAGAVNYALLARAPLDPWAFTRAYAVLGDSIGYVLDQPFVTPPLWYFVVCGLYYLFRSVWAIRILNTVLSSLAAVATALFAWEAYGRGAGRTAGWLMALLPYPVLFCCFGFKDNAVMALTMTLLYHALLVRRGKRLRPGRIAVICLAALALLLLRSGLSAVLLAVCVLLAVKKPKRSVLLVLAAAGLVGLAVAWPTISYKLSFYLDRNASDTETALSMIKVTGWRDLYKLPFAWLFAMITPFGLFGGIRSFYDIAVHLNLTLIPLAVGAALFLFRKKEDPLLYYACLGYYLVSVIPSLGIFRHLFSVMPLTVVFFSAWAGGMDRNRKQIWLGLTALAVLVLCAYYLRRNVLSG